MRRGTVSKYQTETTGTFWRFVIDVGGGRNDRRQIERRGFRTKREAETAMMLVVEEHAGITEHTDEMLLGFLNRWATHRRDVKAIKPPTADSYLHAFHNARRELAGLELVKTTPADLNNVYAAMARTGGRTGDGRSPRTIRYLHTLIRAALDDALAQGLLGRNPARAATPPSAKAATAAERQIWSPEEGRAFLAWDQIPANRRACWLLVLNAGLRRGELAGLTWDDLKDDVLHITRIRTTVAGDVIEGTPKTERSRRDIVLSGTTLAGVRSWWRQQAAQFLAVGLGGGATYVATNRNLKPFPPDDLTHRWRADVLAAVDAGIVDQYMTLHDGRHWHATQLVAAGIDMRTIADRLGHADPGFTLRTYGHSDLNRQRAAAATLDIAAEAENNRHSIQG